MYGHYLVSKVMGEELSADATRRMLGAMGVTLTNGLDLDYVGVKVPCSRLRD